MNEFRHVRRLVIKVGSSSLTYRTGMINIRRVERLCKVISDIKNSGVEVVLVSSGAIAVGTAKLGLACRPSTIPEKQAAAAVGQCELMYIYDKNFTEYHHKTAQVLLTRDVVEDAKRRENARNTFESLLCLGAIPIVNENDTVSTEELEFGDNDTLSALVAEITGADGLVLMSDIDGLYTANPSEDPSARLIPRVADITPDIEALAGGAGSEHGTGGMTTKLQAARIARAAGCVMAIVNSDRAENLYDLIDGTPVGTIFETEDTHD